MKFLMSANEYFGFSKYFKSIFEILILKCAIELKTQRSEKQKTTRDNASDIENELSRAPIQIRHCCRLKDKN